MPSLWPGETQGLQIWVLISAQPRKTPTARNSKLKCGRKCRKDAANGRRWEPRVCVDEGVSMPATGVPDGGRQARSPPRSSACIQHCCWQSTSTCVASWGSEIRGSPPWGAGQTSRPKGTASVCFLELPRAMWLNQTITPQVATRGLVIISKRDLLSLLSHSVASLSRCCQIFNFEDH